MLLYVWLFRGHAAGEAECADAEHRFTDRA